MRSRYRLGGNGVAAPPAVRETGDVTAPKRHHYVPRLYLERFSDDGLLFVRWRDGKAFSTGAANIAVETGFYDLERVDGSTSKLVEYVLSDVEGLSAEVLRRIDERGEAPEPGSSDREMLSMFLALQHTRTPEQRERVMFPERLASFLGNRELTRDLVAEFLEVEHLRFRPKDSEIQAAFDFASVALRQAGSPTAEFSMDLMFRSVEQLAPVIDTLNWTVEHDRKARFVTSDAPLVIWRAPSRRDAFEGVGIANADEVRYSLDTTKQLVLTKKKRPAAVRITSDRVVRCNQDVLAACHRFVVAHPRLERQVMAPDLTPHRPVLRFNTGPLYERQPDGTNAYKGEALHTWVPRR